MTSKVDLSAAISALKEQNQAELFLGENAEPFITQRIQGRTQTFSLESIEWGSCLRSFLRRNSWHASDQRRDEITQELISLAWESGIRKSVSVRIAKFGDKTIVDLNDPAFSCIQISGSGVKLLETCPVPFLRPAKQRALPQPKKTNQKAFVALFKKWFPLDGDRWVLLLTFVLKSLHRDHGSYVILLVEGPQGAGKSTFSARLKELIDPSEPMFFSPPNTPDDIIVASTHSYLLVFDNISRFNEKMADIFCRLSTDGGISKRKHYENHAEVTYRLHRPCIINGIDEPTARADFMDRCLTIRLQAIEQEQRVSETELKESFRADLPSLVGGLYELFAKCLKTLPEVQTKGLARMTDYARMGIAVEKSLELRDGTFSEAYHQNRREQAEESFWSDELCCAIHKELERVDSGSSGGLEGKVDELRDKLFRGKSQTKPGTKGFSSWLRRVEPLLQNQGIVVERSRTAQERKITIRYTKNVISKVEQVDIDELE